MDASDGGGLIRHHRFVDAQQTGAAMTYMQGGRQYIVCAIGGTGSAGASILAFRLPAGT
jgi:hypothetical protein